MPRGVRKLSVMRILQRFGKSVFVLNIAAFWLLITKGKGKAKAYLSHLWWVFASGQSLIRFTTEPLRLPRQKVEELFEGIDLSHIELLYPMPRPGGVSVEELIIICAIVRLSRPKLAVEIGTCEGRTTLNIALHSPDDAQVVTLDLPPDSPLMNSNTAIESGVDYRQMGIPKPGRLFEGHPLEHKIRLILADSTKFDWTPYEGSADLVFVDGAHDYMSVMRDSENALRITKPGGIILWHDYGIVEGVTLALNELGSRFPIRQIDGTSLACLCLPRGRSNGKNSA